MSLRNGEYVRNFDGDTGSIESPAAVRPFVEFYIHAKQNNFKTKEEGRPIFEDREWVRIQFPGDMRTVMEREVREEDKIKYQAEYSAFKTGQEVPAEGTPIREWPEVGRSQAEEFSSLGIRTVEDLANLSDGFAQNIQFGGLWRERAVNFLKGQTKTESENEALKTQLAALQKQVEDFTKAQTTAPKSTASKQRAKPGRKKSTAVQAKTATSAQSEDET